MTWSRRKRARLSLVDAEVAGAELHSAREQLRKAQSKRQELKPLVARLEKHLEENNFSRMIWQSFRGA